MIWLGCAYMLWNISYYCRRISAANYPHNGLCCASNCHSCTVCPTFVDKQYILKSLNKLLTSRGYTRARGRICPHTECSLLCICLAMVVNVHLHLFASACIGMHPCAVGFMHGYSRTAFTCIRLCVLSMCVCVHTHLHQRVRVCNTEGLTSRCKCSLVPRSSEK